MKVVTYVEGHQSKWWTKKRRLKQVYITTICVVICGLSSFPHVYLRQNKRKQFEIFLRQLLKNKSQVLKIVKKSCINISLVYIIDSGVKWSKVAASLRLHTIMPLPGMPVMFHWPHQRLGTTFGQRLVLRKGWCLPVGPSWIYLCN